MIDDTMQGGKRKEGHAQGEIRSSCLEPFRRKSSQKASKEAGNMEILPMYLEYLRELIGSCPNH